MNQKNNLPRTTYLLFNVLDDIVKCDVLTIWRASRNPSISTSAQNECNTSPPNVEKQKAVDENTRGGPQDSTWIIGKSPDQAEVDYFPPLPPQDLMLRGIDMYFSHCDNQPYCIFHENSSTRHFMERGVPDHVLFAVLCNYFRFLGTSDGKHQRISERYAETAWSLVKSKCFPEEEVCDISAVQTMTLLSIFDFTGMKPTDYIENAILFAHLSSQVVEKDIVHPG